MKTKCNTAPSSSGARNKAPKTHSQPSLYHKLIHASSVTISTFTIVLVFSNEEDKWSCSFSNSSVHRDFTSTKFTRAGCSYLKPVVEACEVGITGQLLPNRNNRRVTPAEPGLQGWETQGGEKEPLCNTKSGNNDLDIPLSPYVRSHCYRHCVSWGGMGTPKTTL